MNVLEKIHNHYLSHALHLQFTTEIRELLEKFDPSELNILSPFEIFCISVEREDRCYKIVRKSDISEIKEDADYNRDDTLVGLHKEILALARHFDPEIKRAGIRIKIVFDEYNNPKSMRTLPYDAETVTIENFIQEMRNEHANDMEITSLTKWINELAAKNAEFDKLVKAYAEKQAGKPSFRMKDVRRETDNAYKDIVTILNAEIIHHGENAYSTFISEWNILIKHYNDILAQHKGRNKAKKERAKKEKEEKEKAEKEKLSESGFTGLEDEQD